jgi:hypothetical protein
MSRQQFDSLSRLQHFKQSDNAKSPTFGQDMVIFFKRTVQQRQTKLAKIAERWVALVPETLNEHCALFALTRGTLTVLVDSSVHLYELKQLLLCGMQDQLLLACKSSGLRKITLKPGRMEQSSR